MHAAHRYNTRDHSKCRKWNQNTNNFSRAIEYSGGAMDKKKEKKKRKHATHSRKNIFFLELFHFSPKCFRFLPNYNFLDYFFYKLPFQSLLFFCPRPSRSFPLFFRPAGAWIVSFRRGNDLSSSVPPYVLIINCFVHLREII
jgi:hypothetical protein